MTSCLTPPKHSWFQSMITADVRATISELRTGAETPSQLHDRAAFIFLGFQTGTHSLQGIKGSAEACSCQGLSGPWLGFQCRPYRIKFWNGLGGKALKDELAPLKAPSTIPVCSKPHPTWIFMVFPNPSAGTIPKRCQDPSGGFQSL